MVMTEEVVIELSELEEEIVQVLLRLVSKRGTKFTASVSEIHEGLSRSRSSSRSTIYRTVQALSARKLYDLTPTGPAKPMAYDFTNSPLQNMVTITPAIAKEWNDSISEVQKPVLLETLIEEVLSEKTRLTEENSKLRRENADLLKEIERVTLLLQAS